MPDVRRRELIALLACAAAWPMVARAQQPAMPVIGFLSFQFPGPAAPHLSAYRRGLTDNATGISFFTAELVAKQLGLLHELLPGAVRVAVLVNPADAARAESISQNVEAAARLLGLQIAVLNASTAGEIDAVFASPRASGPTPSSSEPTHSLTVGVSNWPRWRRATRSPPHRAAVMGPKRAYW
jgi:putative ABC transport system substrate-binding protein